ncbi:MAG: magnesium transporter [Candidatus Goldbacteria bacterium]|nr:magnesium transporter [Candidatus Goldiibacteriota bacterium]
MEENKNFKIEKNIIVIDEDLKISQAIKKIRRASHDVMIFYVYVIDKFGVLRGVLPLKNLFLAEEKRKVKDVMIREPITISEKLSDEEILEIFNRTKFLALPVVDDAYRLKGIITYKNAVDVIRNESAEDVLKIHGADIHIFDETFLKRIKIKLPWLLTSVISGIICGWILNKFEVALQNAIALAFFIPLITAMGESVASQTSAIIIEGIAINKIDVKNTRRLLFFQMMESMIIALIITLIVFFLTVFWLKNFFVIKVIGITIFFGIIIATIMGTLGPIILKKSGFNPAAATSSIVLALSDILILVFYFSVAILLNK